MVPGAPSMNPSGRPKGAAGLARYIAEQTDDGRELVDRLMQLARTGPAREASAAIMALLDRLAGKAMQPSEVAMTVSASEPAPALPRGWVEMSPDQRLAWVDGERARRALPAVTGDE